MIDYRILFHLLAGFILVVICMSACQRFVRWRTKYNLAVLVVYILLLIGTILNFFYPNSLKFIGESGAQPLFVTIFMVCLLVFLLYPYISEFLSQRRKKGK
jgi:hypothetical protein